MTEGASERPSVLLVEDEWLVGRACAQVLERHGCDVTHAASAAAARPLLDRDWTAVLLDVGLPDGSGLELARLARARDARLSILLFTGRDDRQLANAAQLVGAEFLYKPATPESVGAFITRALGRRDSGPDAIEQAAQAVAKAAGLTRAEHEVLLEAARNPLREDLAERLGISKNTLKSHVRHLLSKTGDDTLAAAVWVVMERALRERA